MKKIRTHKISRDTVFGFLNVVKFILVLLLFLMFINFNKQIARQQENLASLAESTNSVVKSQGDILTAIQQVTSDTRTTAQEQTAIIICMLQVPIQERTTDLQKQCRKTVTPSGVTGGNNTGTTGTATGSSSNNTPNPTPPQQSISQNSTPTPAPEAPQSGGFLERNILNPVNDNVIQPIGNFLGGLLGVQ